MHQLENHLLRGPTECAAVLGIGYSTYAGYKSGTRPIPKSVALHVEVLLALPLDAMHTVVKKRLRRGAK
jgi:hypothetical protein